MKYQDLEEKTKRGNIVSGIKWYKCFNCGELHRKHEMIKGTKSDEKVQKYYKTVNRMWNQELRHKEQNRKLYCKDCKDHAITDNL